MISCWEYFNDLACLYFYFINRKVDILLTSGWENGKNGFFWGKSKQYETILLSLFIGIQYIYITGYAKLMILTNVAWRSQFWYGFFFQSFKRVFCFEVLNVFFLSFNIDTVSYCCKWRSYSVQHVFEFTLKCFWNLS